MNIPLSVKIIYLEGKITSSSIVGAYGWSSTKLLFLFFLLPVLHSSTSLNAVVAAPLDTATMKHEGV